MSDEKMLREIAGRTAIVAAALIGEKFWDLIGTDQKTQDDAMQAACVFAARLQVKAYKLTNESA